jgi:hypothetical protein
VWATSTWLHFALKCSTAIIQLRLKSEKGSIAGSTKENLFLLHRAEGREILHPELQLSLPSFLSFVSCSAEPLYSVASALPLEPHIPSPFALLFCFADWVSC